MAPLIAQNTVPWEDYVDHIVDPIHAMDWIRIEINDRGFSGVGGPQNGTAYLRITAYADLFPTCQAFVGLHRQYCGCYFVALPVCSTKAKACNKSLKRGNGKAAQLSIKTILQKDGGLNWTFRSGFFFHFRDLVFSFVLLFGCLGLAFWFFLMHLVVFFLVG